MTPDGAGKQPSTLPSKISNEMLLLPLSSSLLTHPDPSTSKPTAPVRYVMLTCQCYVTVHIYPRFSHLKSLASYFGLQVSSTLPYVYYSFLLRTSAIQSLTQTESLYQFYLPVESRPRSTYPLCEEEGWLALTVC